MKEIAVPGHIVMGDFRLMQHVEGDFLGAAYWTVEGMQDAAQVTVRVEFAGKRVVFSETHATLNGEAI